MSLVNQLGTVPILILLVVIFILLFKENKKANESLSRTISSLKDDVRKQLEAADARNEERNKKQDEVIETLNKRVSYVEQNYADKAYVQESFGGWRTEIRELGKRMDRFIFDLTRREKQ
ncbi:hypothetical protein [Parasphaerochaeta coccoides]|nr:hypothetical protein [Parasphaerochaeta coccoides]